MVMEVPGVTYHSLGQRLDPAVTALKPARLEPPLLYSTIHANR
jgi:hypothetical protein